MAKPKEKKMIILGDADCGKTSLFSAIREAMISEGILIRQYEPEVPAFAAEIEVDGIQLELILWDNAHTKPDDYDRLRPLGYPGTDLVLICLSVHTCFAFDNIIGKWIPEVQHYLPKVPFILIGTKKDLRDDPAEEEKLLKEMERFKTAQGCNCMGKPFDIPYQPEDGVHMAEKLKALCYLECSARTKEGVTEVLKTLIKLPTATKEKRSSKCVVL